MKRSIKARTTGKVKRIAKKSIIPFYGKKGMGWIKNPKKALYNKIYNKTTFSFRDILNYNKSKTSGDLFTPLNDKNNNEVNKHMKGRKKGVIIVAIIAALVIIAGISGAVQESKEKHESNTTIVERAKVDSSEENGKEVFIEDTTIVTTEKTTVTTTKAISTDVKTTNKTEMNYILNTSSMKFHYPTCRGVKDMKKENKKEFSGDRKSVIDMGYSPCGICHP